MFIMLLLCSLSYPFLFIISHDFCKYLPEEFLLVLDLHCVEIPVIVIMHFLHSLKS